MAIDIQVSFSFSTDQETDVLLQFEAAIIPEQTLLSHDTQMTNAIHFARVPAEDEIGDRIWIRTNGRYEVNYTASVEVNRLLADIATLERLPPHLLPGEAIQYMMDSRYCPADRFQSFVEAEFGDCSGGARIVAIRDWIAGNFAYTPGSSDGSTTALDSFVERRGVCRDYAHVMITLARASGIPARYVGAFAPGVTPQDFHALAEVFLADATGQGGTWHLVDATGMADPAKTVKIGVGRDAADVSFLTSFGMSEFLEKQVSVVDTQNNAG